jgi:hypothetical protein
MEGQNLEYLQTGTTDIPLTANGEATVTRLGEKVAGAGSKLTSLCAHPAHSALLRPRTDRPLPPHLHSRLASHPRTEDVRASLLHASQHLTAGAHH